MEQVSMPNTRVEPTFDEERSTKPGSIRAISVDEYKKQIEAARKSDEHTANLLRAQVNEHAQDEDDELSQSSRFGKAVWKKIFSATIGITLIGINVALIYFELESKTLKPTFSVATPWGVAEVWTPWGTDGNKIAQLDLRKLSLLEKENNEKSTISGAK